MDDDDSEPEPEPGDEEGMLRMRLVGWAGVDMLPANTWRSEEVGLPSMSCVSALSSRTIAAADW